MKLEVMAKNVVVGDVLVKGAHKYDVTDVKKTDDLVTIAYATKKSKEIRTLDIEPSVFVKVEQTEEDKAEIAKKAAGKFDKDLHYTLEIEEFGGSYTLEHMCFIGVSWDDRLKFEDLEMKMHFIDPKKIISFKRQHEEKTNEVAADPVEQNDEELSLKEILKLEREEAEDKRDQDFREEMDEIHEMFKNEMLLNELPHEAKTQIVDVYCVDQEKEVDELTLEEIISETKWCIERMKMDISEHENVDDAKRTIKDCEAFLEKYEVTADPVEETNDKPAEDLNAFYVNVCKEEIEKLENYLADEVDEDHKAFLKSRIENRKIELEFLETGKQPEQETNEVAADPVENVTVSPVEVDQFEVRSLVNSYMQWETLEKVAEQKGDDEGKHKCNANKWAIADRAGNVDVHFANAFAKELEQRRKLS